MKCIVCVHEVHTNPSGQRGNGTLAGTEAFRSQDFLCEALRTLARGARNQSLNSFSPQ